MKKLPKLTRKQKAFADELIANPRQSATKAVLKTYGTDKDYVAGNIATENLRKPNILIYLEEHGDRALRDNLEIAAYSKEMGQTFSKEGASYASVASQINRDILDRVLGKATQRIEAHTTGVTLKVDLTSSLDDTTV